MSAALAEVFAAECFWVNHEWTRIFTNEMKPRISYETGASGMGYNTGSSKRPNF
jgi:hypothetical protein